MRNYELVCIIHPDLDENAFNALVEKIKGWIGETGGTAEKVEIWGRKRLASLIKKQREGQYVLFNMTIPAAATTTLDQNLRFQEAIIRYMITAVE